MSEENEYLSWDLFDVGCIRIAQQVKDFNCQNIFGQPRGGLVMAVRLSHLLEIPIIVRAEERDEDTLVVDDITDSGHTLKPFRKNTIATMYYNRKSIVIPDVWIFEKTRKWIVFPWEVIK